MPKQPWKESEIVTLCAIFISQDFNVGDDNSPTCKLIADNLSKSTGTVDMQWRNIKSYYANKDTTKVGKKVKYWAESALRNPKLVKRLALYYCDTNNWELKDLMELNND